MKSSLFLGVVAAVLALSSIVQPVVADCDDLPAFRNCMKSNSEAIGKCFVDTECTCSKHRESVTCVEQHCKGNPDFESRKKKQQDSAETFCKSIVKPPEVPSVPSIPSVPSVPGINAADARLASGSALTAVMLAAGAGVVALVR